jgi:hypothetical protein
MTPSRKGDGAAATHITSAGVAFMITRAMKEALRERGLTPADIQQMTPEEAGRILMPAEDVVAKARNAGAKLILTVGDVFTVEWDPDSDPSEMADIERAVGDHYDAILEILSREADLR